MDKKPPEDGLENSGAQCRAPSVKSFESTAPVVSSEPLAAEFPQSIFEYSPERWPMVAVVALAACTSTLSVPIYFPIITELSDSFNVSVSKINLTATVYSIFQGVSPIFWAALSDVWGRRPVYFCCIIIYLGANIGLARSQDYSTLLGLRILQAFGAASTVSLIGGTIGDFSTRRTRGALVGVAMGISQLGNCFGPLIGSGLNNQFGSWRAIFWGLTVYAGLTLVLVFALLPETNRHIVGNGSRAPLRNAKYFMSRSIYARVRHHLTGVPLYPSDPGYSDLWFLPPRDVQWLRWTQLMVQPRVIMMLVPTALHYTTWYMVLTAQSTLLASDYHFGTHKIGYTYLASGIGTLGCSLMSGNLMQHNYKKHAMWTPVNIYKARMGYSFYATAMVVAGTLVFGWTLHFKVTFYVPVVMSFFISFGATLFLNTSSALLVDLFPGDSAASQSCNNLARCLTCAGGLAALQSMMDNMTIGGTFSFLAGLCALSSAGVWAMIMKYGPKKSDQTFVGAGEETVDSSSDKRTEKSNGSREIAAQETDSQEITTQEIDIQETATQGMNAQEITAWESPIKGADTRETDKK